MQKHLFMSYNSYGVQMCEPMRLLVRDSLVFDRSRKSIYTQGEEYGYIANSKSEALIYDSNYNILGGVNLTVQDGITSIENYKPLTFTLFNTTGGINPQGDITLSLGQELEINDISYNVTGTQPIEELYITLSYYNSTTDNEEFTYILRNCCQENKITGVEQITLSSKYTVKMTTDKLYVNSTTETCNKGTENSVTLTMYGKDTRIGYNDIEPSKITKKVSWYNKVFVTDIKTPSNGTIDDIAVLFTETADYTPELSTILTTTSYIPQIYFNSLTDTPFEDISHINQIDCKNGPSTYIMLALPARLAPKKDYLGVLNNSATQEFELLSSTCIYTNEYNIQEPYKIYVSTGQNWNGSKLYFN